MRRPRPNYYYNHCHHRILFITWKFKTKQKQFERILCLLLGLCGGHHGNGVINNIFHSSDTFPLNHFQSSGDNGPYSNDYHFIFIHNTTFTFQETRPQNIFIMGALLATVAGHFSGTTHKRYKRHCKTFFTLF